LLYLFHYDPFLYIVALKVESAAAMSKLIGTSNSYEARLLMGGEELLEEGMCGKEVNNK
jgi:hypothetical protein